MDYLIIFFVFIFGLVIGSFLNVVIFRLDTEDEIVNSRSKCMHCNHLLGWYDLFPVFSFLFLRGKCRYCRVKISRQYPIVEMAAGIFFVLIFGRVFQSFDPIALAESGSINIFNFLNYFGLIYIFSALLVVFVFDLKDYIIPDEVIYPAIVVALLWKLLELSAAAGGIDLVSILQMLLPAVLAGGFFLAIVLATKGEGMGGGDVKLGFLMGLVLGFANVLLALFVAFISGALVGVALISSGKKKMKSMVPFGPFLILGFLISFFYGREIIAWYWGSFIL